MGRPELKRKKGRKKEVFIRSWFDKLEKKFDEKPSKKKVRSKRKFFGKDIIVKKQIVRVNIPHDASGTEGDSAASESRQFGYIYNLKPQVVPIESEIIFDTNGILTPGIAHVPGTTQITVADAGNYEVHFSVSGAEPNQFAIFINGTLAEGTLYGSEAGTQQNTGQAILALACGDVLTLRNHSSATTVMLQTLAGGTQASINASIIIRKLR
ncbi:BclA C-terminal domain-containing protein [Paenibacillus terrae]